MMQFSMQQKLEAVDRELTFRRRVYARRLAEKKMTQAKADHEICVMEAIKADYEKAVATNEPSLF
jgi:hypothetical protein